MTARKKKADVARLGRFVRGRRFDRNPLRRASDRVETAVLALLVVMLLAGAPLAARATGSWLHGMAQRTQSDQEASRRQVTAVVLSVTKPGPDDQVLPWQAQARWKAPNGRLVTNEIPVPTGTAVGGTVPVWSGLNGDPATAPLVDSQVAGQAIFGEVLGVIGAVTVVTMTGAIALSGLNRRRMAEWDADWRVTGPRWTTRA